MKENINNETFETHDIALAASLVSFQHALVRVDRSRKHTTGRVSFVFQSQENTNSIIRDFEMDQLEGKLRSYSNNLKYLKSKLKTTFE